MSFYSDGQYGDNDGGHYGDHEESEGLTLGEPVSYMCLPCSITATCVSSKNHTTASLTFSKVVLTAEETRVYQIPWEKQQKKLQKSKQKSLCFCWCCVCTCLCKPVNNRLSRRVSMSNHDLKRRTACYKQLVEQNKPSVEQLQKWSVDFDDLLHNELGRKLFYLFLQQEHSEENLQFWNEVNILKEATDSKDKTNKMRNIYKEFVKPMALKEVNIAGNTRRLIEDLMETKPSETMFDGAQQQVFLMMHRQSYPRFLQSEIFGAVLQATYAYNPNSPKPDISLRNAESTTIQQTTDANTIEEPPPKNSPRQQQLHLTEDPSKGKSSPRLSPVISQLAATGKSIDRHNSMPSKRDPDYDKFKVSNNKLAARNSSKI